MSCYEINISDIDIYFFFLGGIPLSFSGTDTPFEERQPFDINSELHPFRRTSHQVAGLDRRRIHRHQNSGVAWHDVMRMMRGHQKKESEWMEESSKLV